MERGKAREVRVTAKSLEQAIDEAAVMLGIATAQIEYKVVSQTAGFLFIGKKVEIAARPKGDGETEEGKLREELYSQQPEMTTFEIEELKAELKEFCAGICGFYADGVVEVTAELSDGRLVLDIADAFFEAQIMKNSKLAESMEHVLRKKPRHLKRELPFRIFVDARGVRRKREEDLVQMAKDLSEKVHENKRPIVLNYKSSYDRKIIHMALDKDARVYTKSIGSGPNRKLMILPIKDRQGEAQEVDI